MRFPKLAVMKKVVPSSTFGFGSWRWKGGDCPAGQMQMHLAQVVYNVHLSFTRSKLI